MIEAVNQIFVRYVFRSIFVFVVCDEYRFNKSFNNKFREYVWLSIADIIGIIIGSILSIISFALVIFVYERSLPKPESIEPPNDHELAK